MDDTTAEIKRAVDIVSIIGEYRPVHSEGSKYKTLCPFHDDHKPSMVIDPKYQSYKCWACGVRGDVFTFVQEMEKISFVEAKERLAERAGITLRSGSSDRKDSRQSLYQVLSWAQKVFENSLFTERTGAEARQYLRGRGLTEETARKYGLGFAPSSYEWLLQKAGKEGFSPDLLLRAGLAKSGDRGPYDLYRGRLIFPIRDERNRVLGFGGRILPAFARENSPKYVNSPASDVYNKSEVLYGIEVAAEVLKKRPAKDETPPVPVVMEGYTDCLMAWQAGLKTAIATCGTALTPQHVRKLKQFTSYSQRAVLMFDGDEAGQKAAKESTKLFLSSELDLRLCVLPDGLDPCDFIKDRGLIAIEECIDQSPDALDYIFQRARRLAAGGSIDEERRALEEVLEHLSTIPLMTGSSQQAMVNLTIHRLVKEFGQKEEGLRKRIDELRSAKRADLSKSTSPQRLFAATSPEAPNSSLEPVRPEVEELDNDPMDPRECQVVQALVAFPGRAGEFRELFPLRDVKNRGLRKIAEACYELYEDLGNEATIDAIRERLDDRRLDEMVMNLLDSPRTWENPDAVLEEIKERLRDSGQRRTRRIASAAAEAGDDSQELDKLRRLLGNAS